MKTAIVVLCSLLLALAPPCAGMAPAPELEFTYPRDGSATEFIYYCTLLTAHTPRPRTRALLVAMVTRRTDPVVARSRFETRHAVLEAFNYGLTDRSYWDDILDYPGMFVQNFDGTHSRLTYMAPTRITGGVTD